MNKILNIFFIFIFLNLLIGCSKVRDSAGVTRKSFDEYQVIENPPLVIPPDLNLGSSQLERKDIKQVEQDLAKEILFGIDKKNNLENPDSSTMNKILIYAEAEDANDDIREEINEDFMNEKKSEGIILKRWKNESEILDATEESERIRNQLFENEPINEGEILIEKKEIEEKKKKRFIFF